METKQIVEEFNQGAGSYDSQRKLLIPCFDDFYGLSVSFLKKIKNSTRSVLDLGAGTGLLAMYLYDKYPNARFTLVDISEQMLDIARQRFCGQPDFAYLTLDYSREFPPGQFDLIASALSIHHLENEDKRLLYSKIYNQLEKGGYLLNLDQFDASSGEMKRSYNDYWYEYIIGKFPSKDQEIFQKRRKLDRENTIDATKHLLAEVGFKNVECIYQYLKFGVIIAEK
ncbi:MAG: class I SAM-dependent methyltransferase [Planctomycetaceae bacterium]|nr:class I SAM-dependent methyltransferase [Planctomycetaceae bacterium]